MTSNDRTSNSFLCNFGFIAINLPKYKNQSESANGIDVTLFDWFWLVNKGEKYNRLLSVGLLLYQYFNFLFLLYYNSFHFICITSNKSNILIKIICVNVKIKVKKQHNVTIQSCKSKALMYCRVITWNNS